MFKSILEIDYTFRNYYYAITHISWKLVDKKKESYIDANYIIIIANRTFILVNTQIKKITNRILIRGLRFKIYHFDEYVILIFYIKGVLLDNTRVFIEIIREIYIINDLKTEILIKVDILILERINIDFASQSIFIDSYRELIVFINSRARSKSIKRIIKLSAKTIVSSHITI